MKKALALSLLVITSVLAYSFTLDDAKEAVAPFIFQGESASMKPTTITLVDDNAYWVIEAVSFNQISVMFPFNAETGKIETDENAKLAVKTHYLANFFETNDDISDYLDDEKSFAQQRQDAFQAALQQFEVYEAQLPENYSFQTLAELKTELEKAISKAEAVRSQVINTKNVIHSIQSSNDITSAKNSLDSFFSKQSSFLDSCKDVATKAGEFETELAESGLQAEEPSLAQALQGVISTYSLKMSVTAKEDSLEENKAVIDSFFQSLDSKANDYMVKLENRLASLKDKEEIDKIMSVLENYSNEYENLTEQAQDIPSSYMGISEKMNELRDKISQGYDYCSSSTLEDCEQAKALFKDIESLISQVKSIITSYTPTECVTGTKSPCYTPNGKKGTRECINGRWAECKPVQGVNYYLVIGVIALILVGLLYKFKDKFFKKEETEETGSWEKYGFQ